MLQDQNLAQEIDGALALAQEAATELLQAVKEGDLSGAQGMLVDLEALLSMLERTGVQLAQMDAAFTLDICMESALDSLLRLTRLLSSDPQRALRKIEFELIPLIREARMQFYYWGCVAPDPRRIAHYYEHERAPLAANPYIDEAMVTGKYKYELSIVIFAYNKAVMTKECIESLLAYLPEGLNYELILYNHGSTDGTMRYFESLHPTKQIDVKVNGVGIFMSYRVVEGEFVLFVSNDILFTQNAVENMLRCIKEDASIGLVVPTTPNVSNKQTIPGQYTTLDEMWKFARENNQYDPYRHEQRARLCDPLSLHRSATLIASSPYGFLGHFLNVDLLRGFPDDLRAMLYRRNGIKSILAKDAFCHHHGSATLATEIDNQQYVKGRVAFWEAFGIDPWGTGACFAPAMLPLVQLLDKAEISVLGVNAGMGSNPLKVKEMYKEDKHNLNIHLTNAADKKWMLRELVGVSDAVAQFAALDDLFEPEDRFDHIVCDEPLQSGEAPIALAKACHEHLHPGGSLLFHVQSGDEDAFKQAFPDATFSVDWARVTR
jgi:hypothetical protein